MKCYYFNIKRYQSKINQIFANLEKLSTIYVEVQIKIIILKLTMSKLILEIPLKALRNQNLISIDIRD